MSFNIKRHDFQMSAERLGVLFEPELQFDVGLL